MLNPSTADATLDDPTIRRCIGFAHREGAGGITVANLYAFRATDPKALRRAADPIGPRTPDVLFDLGFEAAAEGRPIVCAWGAHGGPRGEQIARELRSIGASLVCLGRTARGAPRHPLYVPSAQPLVAFV